MCRHHDPLRRLKKRPHCWGSSWGPYDYLFANLFPAVSFLSRGSGRSCGVALLASPPESPVTTTTPLSLTATGGQQRWDGSHLDLRRREFSRVVAALAFKARPRFFPRSTALSRPFPTTQRSLDPNRRSHIRNIPSEDRIVSALGPVRSVYGDDTRTR